MTCRPAGAQIQAPLSIWLFPFSCRKSFPLLAQCYLFFRVLAADQRDARYAFAQSLMASSLRTPWPVGCLRGTLSKREVRALTLPLAFGMNVTRRCFPASVAHAFSAGQTKALEGGLIVPSQHRNNEGHMKVSRWSVQLLLHGTALLAWHCCEDAR